MEELISIPFPNSIPYDVICAVIEMVDFETLKTISLLSRDSHHEAAKRLWRKFTLATKSPPSRAAARRRIEEGLGIIMKRDRIVYVRDLRIWIWVALGSEVDPAVEPVCESLFSTLANAVNLTSLEVTSYQHEARIIDGLARTHFAPFLSNFVLNLGVPHDAPKMDGFWISHPHIVSLGWGTQYPLSLPLGTLPSLRRVTLQYGEQGEVVRGRSIMDVSIQSLKDEHCSSLIENLMQSTAEIECLEVRFTGHQPTATAFSTVIARLPHLRFLKIIQERMPPPADHIAAMEALASLRKIETIEWGGLRGPDKEAQEHFFSACSKYCPSLRRVTFHRFADFSRTLVRKNQNAEWVDVSQGGR